MLDCPASERHPLLGVLDAAQGLEVTIISGVPDFATLPQSRPDRNTCLAAGEGMKGWPAISMKPKGKLSKADLARVAERLRHSNPVNHFGILLVRAERGRVVFRMPVRELHKQIHRVVHGGVLAMLADTAGGFASFLAAPAGSRVATI